MDLEELYKKIKNPLEDLEVLKSLVDMYSNSKSVNKSFYTKIIGYDFGLTKVSLESKNQFFALMFNNWKKEIIDMTKEDFLLFKEQGRLHDDFIYLREYLKNVSDVKGILDIYNLKNNLKENYTRLLLDKYDWQGKVSVSNSWFHVNSYYYNKWRQDKLKISHRLYLNPDPRDLYDLAIIIAKKFNDRKLIHHFKIANTGNRDDSIVIYSDTEKLNEYINILLEIKSERLDIISRFKESPILAGKINHFIGYGSEPKDSKSSYNLLRAELIEKAIDVATIKWLIQNKDRVFNYRKKQMTLKEIINLDATVKFIEHLYEKDEDFKKVDCKELENKLLPIIMDFNQKIFNKIFNMETSIKDETIRFGKEKVFTYGYNNVSNLLRSNITKITKLDPKFYYSVKKEIEGLSENYGIDKDNFCFNSDIKAIIKNNQNKKTV